MARRHIIEHCMALTAEPNCDTLFAAKLPISAAIPSVLVPEFCVQHVLTRKQRRELKLALMVSTDRLGAPLSLTGTHCDHQVANNVDEVLDYEANLSDDDLLSKEVSEDWLNNPDPNLRTTALGTHLLSRFVLPPPNVSRF
jgi:hypothetical protein